MPHPVEDYLKHLRDVRMTGAGTGETSYYEPLAELLNALGKDLAPEVGASRDTAAAAASG